jgi:hypothetical protein
MRPPRFVHSYISVRLGRCNGVGLGCSAKDVRQRITHNTRYFSGNYLAIIAVLAVYALITNPLLLLAIFFLVGGFIVINKFGQCLPSAFVPGPRRPMLIRIAPAVPEPVQMGDHVVTQKSLYTGTVIPSRNTRRIYTC